MFSIIFPIKISQNDAIYLPRIGTMFNFAEIYGLIVNPLTISHNVTSISFFVKKLFQKYFWVSSLNPTLRVRVNFELLSALISKVNFLILSCFLVCSELQFA